MCSTSSRLRETVAAGAFREDLFNRIAVFSLDLSPLRDRKNDIPQLCEYFLEKLSRQFGRGIPRLHPVTMHLLKQWDWPGNLRELENWSARAVILGDDKALGAELKRQLELAGGPGRLQPRISSLREATDRATSAVTSALLFRALQANRWNRRKTAEELKMSYRALLYKLRDAGLSYRRRSHRGRSSAHE